MKTTKQKKLQKLSNGDLRLWHLLSRQYLQTTKKTCEDVIFGGLAFIHLSKTLPDSKSILAKLRCVIHGIR